MRASPRRCAATTGYAAAALLALAPGDGVGPAAIALVYDAGVLLSAAVAVRAELARPAPLDVVVELAEVHGIEQALARALEDPGLRLVAEQRPAEGTVVVHGGEVLGTILHRPHLLDDDALRREVTAAAALTTANARLVRELEAQVAEGTRAARRLVEVGDEQRRALERLLDEGAVRLLDRVDAELAGLGADVAPLRDRLGAARTDIADLARGLHPRSLEQGLAAAVGEIARSAPIPVAGRGRPRRVLDGRHDDGLLRLRRGDHQRGAARPGARRPHLRRARRTASCGWRSRTTAAVVPTRRADRASQGSPIVAARSAARSASTSGETGGTRVRRGAAMRLTLRIALPALPGAALVVLTMASGGVRTAVAESPGARTLVILAAAASLTVGSLLVVHGGTAGLGAVTYLVGVLAIAPQWVGLETAPAVARSAALAAGPLLAPALLHATLSLPGGRIKGRRGRVAAAAAWAATVVVTGAWIASYDPFLDPGCYADCTVNSLMVDANPQRANDVRGVLNVVIVVVSLAVVALVARRLALPARAAAAGLALASVGVAARAVTTGPTGRFGLVDMLLQGALVVACLVLAGYGTWLLTAPGRTRRRVMDVARGAPGDLRATLRETLGDPALDVAYALADEQAGRR